MSSRAPKLLTAAALTLTTVLVVGVVGFFAARTPGYASTSVDTTQRAAWVTKSDQGAIGLLNQQVNELEAPAFPEGSDFDLLQQRDVVIVYDTAAHTLQSLDTANVILSGKMTLPDTFAVAMSAESVAVADQATGDLWTMPTVGLGSGDLTSAAPSGTAAPGAVVTVSGTTTTAVAPGSDAITTVQQQQGDGPAQVATAAVPGGAFAEATPQVPDPVSITSVGDIAVALDKVDGRIVTSGRSIDLPDGISDPVLQQPGAAADTVLVASTDALLTVNLTTGDIRSEKIPQPGDPSAPVQVGGCAHGAWAGDTATYLAWCGSEAEPRTVDGAAGSEHLKFRVNAQTVVLNDTVTGNVWVLDDKLTLVNNWEEILVEKQSVGSGEASTDGPSDKTTTARQNCTSKTAATPPSPKPDKYGVRGDHPRTLQVLDNDLLSNCSVTVITTVTGSGVVGDDLTSAAGAAEPTRSAGADDSSSSARIVDSGSAIQFTFGKGVTQPVTLSYTVSDGLGNEAESKITVNPVTDPEPIAPKGNESTTAVVVGGTVTEEVLSDWDSPSGDELFLTRAESSVPDDRVTFTPAGEITFTDAGTTGATKKQVSFWLSDGTHTAKGTLNVNVEQPGKAEPLAAPVYASGVVDAPIRIAPLESVFWAGSDELTLADTTRSHNSSGGLTVNPDGQDDTITVSAAEPGTYYLDYHVSAGDKEATGVIRVDVRQAPDQVPAPVVGTDVAYLPSGGETLVDLVANDVDTSGGIVAVQQISPVSGLQLQLTDMHLVKISARRPLPAGGVWVPYTASAGGASSTGWLHVVGVPQPKQALSPTASPISLSVRAGDALTIPIADYATDPTGALLTPVPFADDVIADDAGLLFTAEAAVRYLAPATGPVAKGKTIRTQYTVVNPAGKKSSANLVITVVPTGDNSDPGTPPEAISRVFAGGTVDLDLPLDGVDPDGDWTILSSLEEPPGKGSATPSGTSSLRYTAFDEPGLDSLTYSAADQFGGTIDGSARVLVVPLPKTAEPPVAPDLKVTVAPGRGIAVNALGEATDPAGLPISFTDKPLEYAADAGIKAEVADGALVIKAGEAEKTATIRYTVQNTRKRTATGTVTVVVSKKAPKLPPKAQDVLVTESMLNAGRTAAVVDVSSWVANPGGMPADLVAGVPAVSDKTLEATGKRTLQVPITDRRQIVAYQVTNADKLTARAFLIVPSRDDLNIDPPPAQGGQAAPEDPDPPKQTQQSKPKKSAAAPTKTPKPEVFKPKVLQSLTVDAGDTVDFKAADYIGGVKNGRTLTVPKDAELKATQGSLTRLDAATLRWAVPEDAGGDAGLTVTVSDGVAKPSKVGIRASITPKQPDPPVFQNTGIQVEPGKSASTGNLLDLVIYDADKKANLTFSEPTGGDAGVTASLSDGSLVVTAATSAAKGTETTFTVTVSDGVNEPVPATFPVTVTGSQEPLATVTSQPVVALAGQPSQVNALEGSTNPFPDTALTLLHVEPGENYAVDFTADGSVTVTPAADYSGVFEVPFVVGDATGDPDRQVSGTLSVTVKGKPSAPGTPTKLAVGNGTVTVQWELPADNGAPISEYLVKGSNGYQKTCASSPCELDGLTNDVTYKFTVAARNEVGLSEASNASGGIRPDTAPEAPSTPAVTAGDGQIDVSWSEPANNGSPITEYQVTISPAPADGPAAVKLPVSKHTHTFTGLKNGTKYAVQVRALNKSGTPGELSPGAPSIPAGLPSAPAGLTVSAADEAGAKKTIDVSWKPADANGDEPTYQVSWTTDTGDAGSKDVGAGVLAYSIPAELGVEYTVSVGATNKAGSSEQPATADPVRPFTAPGTVTGLAAVATGENNQVTLSWEAAADNGRPIEKYMYNDGVNGWRDANGTETSLSPPDLVNGKQYTFQVRACHAEASCGAESEGVQQTPYGPPPAPQNVTADPNPAPASLVLNWQAPADNGGREIAGYRYRQVGTEQWVDAGNATTATVEGLTNGQQYAFEVQAYNAEENGKYGAAAASANATPYGAPGAPTGLKVSRTGENNQVTFSWTDGAANGRSVTSHQYTTDGGSTWRGITNGGTNRKQSNGNDDLVNGETYTFAVRARTDAPQRNVSEASNSDPATPYGPIAAPSMTVTHSGNTVTAKWNVPNDGNGRPIDKRTVSITVGGNNQNVDVNKGSWSKDVGYSTTVKGTAQFCVSGPNDCKSASDQTTTPDEPSKPAAEVAAGDRVSKPECDKRCRYIAFTYTDFSGGNYHARVYMNGSFFREYDFSLSAGDGKHVFTSFAGDQGVGKPNQMRIEITGADTVTAEGPFPNT